MPEPVSVPFQVLVLRVALAVPLTVAYGAKVVLEDDIGLYQQTRPTGPDAVGGTGCPSASLEVGDAERTAPTPVLKPPEKACS